MTYATLMVHLQTGRSNTGVLQLAGDLAERFHAAVIGIAARQPRQMVYGDDYMSSELFELQRDEIAHEMKQTEAEFRAALQVRVATLEWRSTMTYTLLSDTLSEQARSADLIITSTASRESLDESRAADIGDLIMQAGRPVLIVPAGEKKLKLERALIGWKDTRESRRAVVDALPLLKEAAFVAVVGIADQEDLTATRTHLADVVGWLKRHGIAAEPLASPSTGNESTALYAIAQDHDADVIVAGAYGHSRLREWALGGVTRDLLLHSDCCSLLSH